MRAFLFFTALAFLLVNSAAEEFPNPCKRSDLLPATEVNIRAAADTTSSDLQISSKFALLVVSTSFAYEVQIEPFFIRYVLLADRNKQ